MERLEQVLVFIPVLLVSVVLHEVAHGWVARTQGDHTAERAGRLTLNPVPHIDVMGSIIVPAILLMMPGGLIFGWAKPVPVNPANYRDYRKGDILVSLAGIAVNLLLVPLFILLMALGVWGTRAVPDMAGVFGALATAGGLGILLNLILAVFNLLPIPPLDGSHVLYHLLPASVRDDYQRLGRYGLGILLVLVFLVPGALS
ncbi:MAG TPA: site-2 protease family protein, partial [Longimicrobiales bacterium]|nr:site-2 protease family protein [Longimicrobiales bacterium]